MPFQPQAEVAQADENKPDPQSTLNRESDADSAPKASRTQKTPAYTSYIGPIVHAGSWLRGIFRLGDTPLKNLSFDESASSENKNNIEYSIYCIHGTADTSLAFEKIAYRLLENKPGEPTNWLPQSVHFIHLLTFDGGILGENIEDYAEQLKSKIIKNKDKHVILLGHSRGGDVAAYFTEFLAAEIGVNVHGVIPIGTPFGGSPWAVAPFTLSSSVAEMKPDSPFLKKLHTAMTRTEESSQKYHYLVAEDDFLVSHEDSVIKEHTAEKVVTMQNHGHLSILTSSKVLTTISDWLKIMTTQPLEQASTETTPIKTAFLELDAEIIALTFRPHLWSSAPKLKILQDLKTLLTELQDGNRGEHFPEAKNIGDFIQKYLQTIDPETKLSFYNIIKQNLNPDPLFFWRVSPPKSQTCIDNLIRAYQDVPLPIATAPTTVTSSVSI